jgi:hypothetical protein
LGHLISFLCPDSIPKLPHDPLAQALGLERLHIRHPVLKTDAALSLLKTRELLLLLLFFSDIQHQLIELVWQVSHRHVG